MCAISVYNNLLQDDAKGEFGFRNGNNHTNSSVTDVSFGENVLKVGIYFETLNVQEIAEYASITVNSMTK